jgi:hypothetical protein
MKTKEIIRHRINLIDIMILVACAAVSLFLYRLLLPALQAQINANPLKFTLKYYYLSVFGFPLLAALSFAVPILRLRELPTLPRRLLRQPGVATCTAASIALIVSAIWVSLIWFTWTGPRFSFWPILISLTVWQKVSYAVAGAWITFGLSGRIRRNPDWVERLGRFVGFAWLIAPIWEIVVQIPWF